MSAKRSFDVRSSRSAPAKATSRPDGKVVARKAPRDRRPLKVRRQEAWKRTGMLFLVTLLVLVGVVLFLLWRPEVRITRVEAAEAYDPAALTAIAEKELEGTYYLVIPRDSFFFYPERSIRRAILDAYPSASSVSISRIGFDAIAVRTAERVEAFVWCGSPGGEGRDCYSADAEGFVFARAPELQASSTALRVYSELGEGMGDAYPLRFKVQGAGSVPDILRFVRAVESLGILVDHIAIRGDEADLYTNEGVRITYVIGHEEAAAKGAAASFPSLNFKDATLEYIDLRFDGKVYLKRTAGVE